MKYDAYIECDKINNPNAETTIDKCAPYVQWNTETGHLTGKFKVLSKGKNGMGSMLYLILAKIMDILPSKDNVTLTWRSKKWPNVLVLNLTASN